MESLVEISRNFYFSGSRYSYNKWVIEIGRGVEASYLWAFSVLRIDLKLKILHQLLLQNITVYI